MGAETTLGGQTDPLQCLFPRLVGSFRNEVGSLVYSLLHLFLVLQRPHLGADTPDDDVLVLGQVLEGLEAARSLGVVLQIKRIHVEVLEQPLRDNIVSSLGEVSSTNEITSA